MIRLTYAGIGARATPHAVLEQMSRLQNSDRFGAAQEHPS